MDRILPSPSHLHVRVKNTTAIPYRAAYLHGPYTLHVSSYPSTFDPYKKLENPRREGCPEFEPNLKAGGNWHSRLTIPQDIRESGERPSSAEDKGQPNESVTWVIEIASQVLFSATASVHYEVLIGRDQRSLDVGFAAIASKGHGEPGKITDLIQYQLDEPGQNIAPKGVYSGAIKLNVEDTTALWNKPSLPTKDVHQRRPDKTNSNEKGRRSYEEEMIAKDKKPRKIHLVILTHGLHSNIGADMLYMKESIDATVRDSRQESRKRRAEIKHRERAAQKRDTLEKSQQDDSDPERENGSTANSTDHEDEGEDDDDDEEVLVRGFPGNAVRTERGIQYLGKRLAKFILTFTYPDQPYLPVGKSLTKTFTGNLTSSSKPPQQTSASHTGSSVQRHAKKENLPYTFTSISFIGHSLGGLIQTYAIAYIHKHSPDFFQKIQPVNFITMAAPLLGLSNENPLYIRFALDFGLVGRTGQDLGLTWRAPTIARNGWSAMIAGFGKW